MQARPYLLAHAYLLTRFTAFDQVGPFARQALRRKCSVLMRRGGPVVPVSRGAQRMGISCRESESMICTLLLLNRSRS